jgi:hypothetical protein
MPKRDCGTTAPELGIVYPWDERVLRTVRLRRRMLRCMQQPAKSQASPASPSFAGLLAELSLPAINEANPAKERNEADLSDDVVTLSYDRALRAHARHMSPDRGYWQPEPAARVDDGLTPLGSRTQQDAFDRDLRTTSVTVRLTKAECASLHERAAEAGLTVSAYLRSCTIEAETLRAQVKAALAELRSAAKKQPSGSAKEGRSWFWWLARFLPLRGETRQAT